MRRVVVGLIALAFAFGCANAGVSEWPAERKVMFLCLWGQLDAPMPHLLAPDVVPMEFIDAVDLDSTPVADALVERSFAAAMMPWVSCRIEPILMDHAFAYFAVSRTRPDVDLTTRGLLAHLRSARTHAERLQWVETAVHAAAGRVTTEHIVRLEAGSYGWVITYARRAELEPAELGAWRAEQAKAKKEQRAETQQQLRERRVKRTEQ